ncbi:MAG: ABC transporter [Lachnospiraceae bacterium]|nr:ABC transporter [Lachnospiraceae bacterium]
MLAVYKKEMRQAFTSIFGYIFLTFLLALFGVYTYIYNLKMGYASFAYAVSSVTTFFLFLVPMLTMRSLSEEKKQKTDQLVFTSPVSVSGIILGKYLALVTILFLAVAVVSTYPLILSKYGAVNMKVAYSNLGAFFLLGCAYLAIGLFLSALTESQIVAAIVTIIVILFTLLADVMKDMIPSDHSISVIVIGVLLLVLVALSFIMMRNKIVSAVLFVAGFGAMIGSYVMKPEIYDGFLTKLLGWFSLVSRFSDFQYGLFDATAYVYYFSIAVLFVFLTIQAIKKRRWS